MEIHFFIILNKFKLKFFHIFRLQVLFFSFLVYRKLKALIFVADPSLRCIAGFCEQKLKLNKSEQYPMDYSVDYRI